MRLGNLQGSAVFAALAVAGVFMTVTGMDENSARALIGGIAVAAMSVVFLRGAVLRHIVGSALG